MTQDGASVPGSRLAAVPVLHGRVEFALEVRRAFARLDPTHVVVELPPALGRPLRAAVRRLPMISVLRVEAGGERVRYLLVEPTEALVEAARLCLEYGRRLVLADLDSLAVPASSAACPDPHAVEVAGLEAWARHLPPADGRPEIDALRERLMAHHVTRALEDPAHRVLLVCGAHHLPAVMSRVGKEPALPFHRPEPLQGEVYHLHPDSVREVLGEMPFLAGAYESWRTAPEPDGPDDPPAAGAWADSIDRWPLPRLDVHRDLVSEARRRYTAELGEKLPAQAVANLFRYARNLALVEGMLVPDFHGLVLAARGVADDNFAWHLWDVGSSYPWIACTDGRASLKVTLEDLSRAGRLVRFERKLRRQRRAMRLIRPRPGEGEEAEWREKWSGMSVCSHPPEDVLIEGYGRFLARKARGILAADNSRSEPFSTSLLDGIDFRETIRNRAVDGRIYVRRHLPQRGDVGSVVVAFDPEDAEGRYPHRMTWQGEHDQESDMALYSTLPGDRVVGPGVSRCEYGGFLLSWPPGRMFFVWEDPEFAEARSPGERLLMAGVDYSEERMVVYVSPDPPRSFLRRYAALRDRKIVYIPMGQLSPLTLKRLRTFHVLDGKEVRSYAADFIW